MSRDGVKPRRLTMAENEFLIGDGSLAGAIAGSRMRFVYDDGCPDAIRADNWREHMWQTGHEAWAFEVQPDYVTDCVVILDRDGPAVSSWEAA